ncbi:MAG: DNA polymerase III subunit gamma/tau [Desulfovibrio sp.]|jgi:DNA polymerase-3 subunit gamma/tau|nr:DNA polymerase III subunit gamma/tau [Desulfovibrio sp.]
MNQIALTIKYRPQTFAQVVGQNTLRTILSRASSENKIAPAYLFSGTRGVGKTTLARIFAKALNCRSAPASEPCNICDLCRAVTAGSAVDVVEIDGASNRGIDDVRRLKEVIGYAPMEGRYKIFIIDEAHMLSREAFNALLKTLEEPPAGVTFIMATTEPHKFPSTIISRCQHYVFKPLPENALTAHLADVLEREGMQYEEKAVRLIARRGAGSVRDAMSMLGQVLALGTGNLTEEAARGVLGLAGQESFMRMIEGFKNSDVVSVSTTLREMLDQGLDMGFFLRELSSLWRNMFILRQSGEAALSVVELPANEARLYLESSKAFSLQYIHACWQMTLEGQRRVLASLEPALGLELLLLNLTILPQLLSLENISSLGRRRGPAGNEGNRQIPSVQDIPGYRQEAQHGEAGQAGDESKDSDDIRHFSGETLFSSAPVSAPSAQERSSSVHEKNILPQAVPENSFPHEDAGKTDVADIVPAVEGNSPVIAGDLPPIKKDQDKDWQTVFSLADGLELPPWFIPLLRHTEAIWRQDTLVLTAQDVFSAERLQDPHAQEALNRLLLLWRGTVPPLEIQTRSAMRKNREELHADILRHTLVKELQEQFGAKIIDYGQIR